MVYFEFSDVGYYFVLHLESEQHMIQLFVGLFFFVFEGLSCKMEGLFLRRFFHWFLGGSN